MRLIIISNRLPLTVTEKNSEFILTQSIGGLATGMNSFIENYRKQKDSFEYLWIGWPGLTIKSKQEAIIEKKLRSLNFLPVFIAESMMEKFNEGFCNNMLWPIFHGFVCYASYEEEQWECYKQVNELFFKKISEVIQPGDVIWIHDYHLLLLPELVRKAFPGTPVGFFNHIPFPGYEMFQHLPNKCRYEILEGMLGADLIGFHTHEYGQNFKKSVLRTMGNSHSMDYIKMQNRLVKIGTFPMGIDFNFVQRVAGKYRKSTDIDKVLNKTEELKIIISVDRLDYTKGIINKLQAYNQFLVENPQYIEHVLLVLLVAPSREKVQHYQEMRRQIDELVGHINGAYGTIGWTPILYQYKIFTLKQLITLFTISHVALVTPIRDGMNLVAKEYVASRSTNDGVLILSEMVGAAKELLDAVIVNPSSTKEVAQALKQAVEMPELEQERRIVNMQEYLKKYDVVQWGMDFLSNVILQNALQKNLLSRDLEFEKLQVIENFRRAKNRLILLDYDGTLVPFAKQPHLAFPNEKILALLTSLNADPGNKLVIVSGRDRATLDNWLGSLSVDLIAEHGVWVKSNASWRLSKNFINFWKAEVRDIFLAFSERLEGVIVEEKEFSISWHYRNANYEMGSQLAKELTDYLVSFTSNSEIRILLGHMVIEVLCAGIGKGIIADNFLLNNEYDFILVIGDDTTDEDMFKALPETAISIKVGKEITAARYHVAQQSDVVDFLNQLNQVAIEENYTLANRQYV